MTGNQVDRFEGHSQEIQRRMAAGGCVGGEGRKEREKEGGWTHRLSELHKLPHNTSPLLRLLVFVSHGCIGDHFLLLRSHTNGGERTAK